MKNILILTDYKGFFGSKQKSDIYNGGMDLMQLKNYFQNAGFEITIQRFTEVDFRIPIPKNTFVLYTSSEDRDHFYKDFIEDILLGLEIAGAILLPPFRFFRAHNNKVFMEILRDLNHESGVQTLSSQYFGTLEDLKFSKNHLQFPVVYKQAAGSKSRGVGLSYQFKNLQKCISTISKSFLLREYLWEKGRMLKYKTYVPNSSHRKKFITQNYIPNLDNDWKVLVYDSKYYVLKRYNRPKDFRASGGGLLEYTTELPEGLLPFCKQVFDSFHVPNISLDIAFDGTSFHLLEFQFIYYGSYTLEYSSFYFHFNGVNWDKIDAQSILEETYAQSIISFIQKEYQP